ncbi:MobH family relaxase [Pseudoalteromonas rubra]|uniref:Uncharacterized domain-containing protein n=1 Tax=Pseudoalteromonas rubra TaxID=43658 RepID=A0A0U2Y7R4_9GAMM|nr:MobH family relaxase [Pseudoalteromonas rubra]ALU46146.1 hypothetical protein AT705_24600 [Pseudoalteromonas rubra]
MLSLLVAAAALLGSGFLAIHFIFSRRQKHTKLVALNRGHYVFDTAHGQGAEPVYLDIFRRPVAAPHSHTQSDSNLHQISAVSVESLMMRYADHIKALESYAKIGSHRQTRCGKSLFTERYLSVIERFIEYAHLLPASEHHHAEPGGLLRHSLEVATLALRQADNTLPPSTNMVDLDEQRHERYIYAAWVGGLMHDLGTVINDLQVRAHSIYDAKTNTVIPVTHTTTAIKHWIPHMESLIEWAQRHRVAQYTIHFHRDNFRLRPDSPTASGSLLLPHILRGEGLEYMMDSPGQLFNELSDTLQNYTHNNSYLAKMLRYGDSSSTKKDLREGVMNAFGQAKQSRAMAIVATLRKLRASWTFNGEKGQAFIIAGHVYLRWQSAFHSLINTMKADQPTPFVKDALTLLAMMEDFAIVEPFDAEHRTISFTPGVFSREDAQDILAGKRTVVWFELVKLTHHDWIYDADPMHPNLAGLLCLKDTKRTFITREDGSCQELHLSPPVPSTTETAACQAQERPGPQPPQAQHVQATKNPSSATQTAHKTPPVVATEVPAARPDTHLPPEQRVLTLHAKHYIDIQAWSKAHGQGVDEYLNQLCRNKLVRAQLGKPSLIQTLTIAGVTRSCVELTPRGRAEFSRAEAAPAVNTTDDAAAQDQLQQLLDNAPPGTLGAVCARLCEPQRYITPHQQKFRLSLARLANALEGTPDKLQDQTLNSVLNTITKQAGNDAITLIDATHYEVLLDHRALLDTEVFS